MTEKRTTVEAPVEESGTPPKPKGEAPVKSPPESNPAPQNDDDPGNTGGAPVDEIDFDGNGQRSRNDSGEPSVDDKLAP